MGLANLLRDCKLDQTLSTLKNSNIKKHISPKDIFYLLQICIRRKDLQSGKRIYQLVLDSNVQVNSFLESHLVRTFAICGSLWEANIVFSKILEPSVFSWGAIIQGYAAYGNGEHAIVLFHQMLLCGVNVDAYVIVSVIKACACTASLTEGKATHTIAINNGLGWQVYVISSLIAMYIKCEKLEDASKLFYMLPKRDPVIWNTMLSGYARLEQSQKAFELFNLVVNDGVELNAEILVTLVKICTVSASLDEGLLLHSEIVEMSMELNVGVGNVLISMYGKLGCFHDACKIFERMQCRDVVTWNAMIAGYVYIGHNDAALYCLQQMQHEGKIPDSFTLVNILKACFCFADVATTHTQIIEMGLDNNISLLNTLIDIYIQYGSLEDALDVFNSSSQKCVTTWTVIISGCVAHGKYCLALPILQRMLTNQIKLDTTALTTMLKACTVTEGLELGRFIHDCIISNHFDREIIVGTALIHMYMSNGRFKDAWRVFEKLHTSDIVTWTSILAGYVDNEQYEISLQLFEQMLNDGIKPTMITFLVILRACCETSNLHAGKLINVLIIESILCFDICIGNSLISMYVKCGSFEDAKRVFDMVPKHDIVTWNAMLEGYVTHGYLNQSISFFQELVLIGLTPDCVTLCSILKACSRILKLDFGRHIHHQIIEGLEKTDNSLINSMIDMYGKCGSTQDAKVLFNKQSQRDIVAWSAMISGYLSSQNWKEALEILEYIPHDHMQLDNVVLLGLLEACSCLTAINEGRLIHHFIVQCGFETNESIGSSLFDMYVKCGSIKDAFLISLESVKHDTAASNVIISACNVSQDYTLALDHFLKMHKVGLNPDDVTFVHLLSLCSDVGLVIEGLFLFKCMTKTYGIVPKIEHYNCMANLLAYGGRLIEAQDLLCTMPFLYNVLGWMSLLNHSKKHSLFVIARDCFDHISSIQDSFVDFDMCPNLQLDTG